MKLLLLKKTKMYDYILGNIIQIIIIKNKVIK